MAMRRAAGLVLSVALAAAAAGCSKGAGHESLPARCAVTGSSVQLVAQDIRFQQRCLGVVANRPFDIVFLNKDGNTAHNVVIYGPGSGGSSGPKVFQGKVITGFARTTYAVRSLPAGTYLFRCEIHPEEMFGRLTVGSASS